MGLSSKKTKQTVKPVYSQQIEGAADTLTNAYNQQAPKINAISDRFLGASGGLLDKAIAGNPAVNAARDYVTNTLGSDPQSNPYLEDLIARTNGDISRGTMTALGTRGLSGSSVAAKQVADRLSANTLGLRYSDYNTAMDRKAQAAGMAPGIAAGEFLGYAPALATADFGANAPLDAAGRYAGGIGGLLGQYTNTTQKQSGGLLGGLLGSVLAGWAGNGFSFGKGG